MLRFRNSCLKLKKRALNPSLGKKVSFKLENKKDYFSFYGLTKILTFVILQCTTDNGWDTEALDAEFFSTIDGLETDLSECFLEDKTCEVRIP